MPREVEDSEGIRWTCTQAYAGLGDHPASDSAAKVDGADRYRVICTPSGGSRSVDVELPAGWEEELSDQELLSTIRRHRK